MAWYQKFLERRLEKLNPLQHHDAGKTQSSKEPTFKYEQSYEKIEIVNRGVNMIVDDAAEIPTTVGKATTGVKIISGIRAKKVHKLLNLEPNLFQDINSFKRNLILDYIVDGNIFVYFDGAHLYHFPASKMEVIPSSRNYIEKFVFDGSDESFTPKEIIHIKENSMATIYRGTSRLRPALRTMNLILSMKAFQDSFFTNGAVLNVIIKSPNTLSEKIKARYLASWIAKYAPNTGGRNPIILDGGLEIDKTSDVNFKDLDFQNSITDNEKIILKALGVPPILLDSGNNANIRPNLRLYYLETILPIVRKINFAFERFFGFELKEDVTGIPALQPELKDESSYYTSLTNGGLITPDEGREGLGYEPLNTEDSSNLRIPANIAGSAANPDEGGKPPEPEE